MKFAFYGCVFFLLVHIASSRAESIESDKHVQFVTLSAPVLQLKPFLWGMRSASNGPLVSDEEYSAIKKKGDPLNLTMTAYRMLWIGFNYPERREEAYALAKRILDYMVNEHEPATRSESGLLLKYKNPTEKLAAGWWSGMDNFFLPVVLNDAAILLNQPDYYNKAKLIFQTISKEPKEGGSVWRDESGCWFSEYTWSGMKESDEYYVLNGHLWALQSVMFYVKQTNDNAATELVECGMLRTQKVSKKFRAPKKKWAYYMLNPSTTNQTHYVIFEKMQFDALNDMRPSKLFAEESMARSQMLKANYPVSQARVKMRDGTIRHKVVFPKSGPPHPFTIDTYGTVILCTDKNGMEVGVIDERNLPTVKPWRRFVTLLTDQKPESCTISSASQDLSLELYTARPKDSRNGARARFLQYQFTAIHDAVKISDRRAIIEPAIQSSPDDPAHYSNVQGRLIIDGIKIDSLNAIFGFELRPSMSLNVGVGLVDQTGREFFRYNPELVGKKSNVILLSPMGFEGIEKAKLPFKTMHLYIYTDKLPKTKIPVELGDFWVATSTFEYLNRIAGKKQLHIATSDEY